MIQAWRIVHEDYLATAFDGKGARIAGGRWNSEGVPVVCTAGSLSLALLEIIVHLEIKKALQHFKAIPVSLSEKQTEHVTVNLPTSWSALPPEFTTQVIGNLWVKRNALPVLSVPSAVVPNETNYLLNPQHSEFSSIAIGQPINLPVDPRMVEKLK